MTRWVVPSRLAVLSFNANCPTALVCTRSLASAERMMDLLQASQDSAALHPALTRLPIQRQILALDYFRGPTHCQLSALTQQQLGTIKSNGRRALATLRKESGKA